MLVNDKKVKLLLVTVWDVVNADLFDGRQGETRAGLIFIQPRVITL